MTDVILLCDHAANHSYSLSLILQVKLKNKIAKSFSGTHCKNPVRKSTKRKCKQSPIYPILVIFSLEDKQTLNFAVSMEMANLVFGIVENDDRFLGTVVNLLRVRKDVKEIFEFSSAEEALRSNKLTKLNFLIIDYRLSGMDGISFLGQLQIRNLKIPKLILTGFDAEDRIFEALKFGATGYMFKNEIYALDSTIDILLAGEASITPTIALRVIQSFQANETSPEETELLTKREIQILKELSNGYPLKKISDTLSISIHTIRVHIRNIYKKLEVNNQLQLLKRAKEIKLL